MTRRVELEAQAGPLELQASVDTRHDLLASDGTHLSFMAVAVPEEQIQMAKRNDFEFYRGEDVELRFTMMPLAGVTDWVVVLTAKSNVGDEETKLQAGPATVAGSGVLLLRLLHEQTVKLAPGTYAYDARRLNEGRHAVISVGIITVMASALY